MRTVPAVVLVHGAWHGGWCWDDLRARLDADSIKTVAVDLPSAGSDGDLAADTAEIHRVLDDLDGDAILVGHSYGGSR